MQGWACGPLGKGSKASPVPLGFLEQEPCSSCLALKQGMEPCVLHGSLSLWPFCNPCSLTAVRISG